MKKQLISLLMAVCMLLSLFPMTALAVTENGETAATSANPFTDVKKSDWFSDAVQYVLANGIFNGTGPDTFDPDGTMTRGMFVTVLGRMAGVNPQDYAGESGFGDVPENQYYAPYVKWASKYGVTTGTGNGHFSPNKLINREQMAVFFVRYFEAFDVNYETGANITTVPADLGSISDYAKDAVLKLWKQGLLNGDGVKFNPAANASRAETAALCKRADEAVETWYKEPGIPSERERVTPTDEEPEKPGSEAPIPGYPGETETKYYEVKFEMGSGQSSEGVTLPETKLYASGTKISAIPTPYKLNAIFLGWYYDDEMTQAAGANDTVGRNMTLYAKMAESTNVLMQETPDYMTVNVPAGEVSSFSFGISDYTEGCVSSFINVTNNKAAVTLKMKGDNETVDVEFAQGQTYRMELSEDSDARFIVGGIAQPATVRTLNIITEKSEVQNLQLGDVKYLTSAEVTDMTGTALDGLFSVSVGARSVAGGVAENKYDGTFTYEGSGIEAGDTVAIYSGTRPDQRKSNTDGTFEDGAVAYLKITKIEGNKYYYRAADAEDVLLTPDVLPVPSDADKDEDDSNNSITVELSVMDFSHYIYEEMGLDSQTTVDVGDFIAFYTGELTTNQTVEYGKITGVSKDDTYYVIKYTPVTEDEVLSAMDLYMTRNEEIVLTDEDKARIEAELELQAIESGFAEEAATYLTALALETDGFKELSDDMDLNLSDYSITFADGTPVSDDTLQLMENETKVEFKEHKAQATVAWGKVLQHFDGKYGVRVELAIIFTVEIDGKYEINVQAVFEQEVLLTINTSGGAIWKWAWIIPYIYDYNLNANIDLGTFTGIGITATAKSIAEEEEGYNWEAVTDYPVEQAIINIGKEIATLMEAKEEFLGEKLVDENGEEIEWGGTNGGGLVEKYAAMLENAEDAWVEVYREEIFSIEGSVDPFHILVFGISADFVVKTNMYVTMGMTFEYGVAKRYNFSVMLFHKKSTNEVIDLEEHHYQFDFYVMGTAGFRAGVELEVAVGLFSLKLDSVGICAETGVYARLWGYFYYHLKWTESGGKESSCSGALLIEIGLYLEISFKAQLFSSPKLTYQPTLYEKEWPFVTIGARENVYDFAYDDSVSMLKMKVESARSFSLPTSLFDMNYMDLKSGELYGSEAENKGKFPAKNYDDNRESSFIVEVSNPKFRYDPNGNTITVEPGLSAEEICEITFTWKGGPAAFTTRAIKRTLTIKWTDPKNTYYIAFNTKGGSSVSVISAIHGAPISRPADPKKTGYDFGGWYKDYACTDPLYAFPTVMQEYPGKGITLYAKWIPRTDTMYKVEHYLQELKGTYTLNETETMTGTTDASTEASAKTGGIYEHFTVKPIAQQSIAPNGSAVVKIYYNRKSYDVSFTYGSLSSADLAPLKYTAKYGSTVYAPMLSLGGYDFDGFNGLTLNEDGGLLVTGNASYNAKWKARTDTPYRVEHYIQPVRGEGYLLSAIESKTGETAKTITAENLKLPDAGFAYQDAKVGGQPVTAFAISADGKTVVKLYYNRNTYNLTFMSDGTEYQSDPVFFGSGLQAPAAPTKEGFTFSGWYENADFSGNAFSFETSPTMPAKNLTLYAKWTARGDIVYKVEHYKQLANGSYADTPDHIDTLRGTTDATVTAIPKGYEFFSLDEGDMRTVRSGTVLADGTLVLKLYYARDTYTLSFKNHDGSVISSTSVRHGDSISVPTPTINPGPGYDLSWSPAVPAEMPTQDATYQAVWTPKDGIDYTVIYYLQDAEDDGYTSESHSFKGTTGASVTAPVKNDLRFTENETHEGRRAEGVIAGDGTLVLKRYYDRVTFDVTFNAGGGTLTDGEEMTFRYGQKLKVNNPTRGEDYAFDGWYDESGTKYDANFEVTRDLSLTARWKAGTVNYTVEHYIMNTNGSYPLTASHVDSTKNGIVDETLTLSTLQSDAYQVEDGIVYSHAEVDGKTEDTVNIKKGMVVKLYYERKFYDVEWDLMGGEKGSDSYPESVYYKANITQPRPTKTGHTFAGWYTDESLKNEFTDTGTMPAGPLTLYAKWTTNQYTITFVTGGGSTVSAITRDYGVAIIAPEAPTKEGYAFAGWDKEIPATMPAENMSLTAKWDVITYNITYTLNDGEATNPTTYTIESSSFALTNPVRKGYTFAGWTGTGLSDATMNVTIYKGSTGHRSYTATWTPITYTISYTLNSGTVSGNPTSYTIESGEFTLNNPTRSGYTFAGWTGTGLSGATRNVIIPKGSTGNRSYTATWTPIQYTITYRETNGSVINQVIYTIADEFELPAPEKQGYDFLGWTGTGISGSDPVKTVEIKAGSTGDREYTAHWQVSDYKIKSVSDLESLRNLVKNGQWTGAQAVILDSDIQLPEGWTSIGTWDNPFKGVFDGKGYTITYNGSATYTQALFGGNAGTIQNLKISINGIVKTETSFGAVVATNYGTVQNCHVAATTQDSLIVQEGNTANTGGVVGTNAAKSGTNLVGKIINCSVGSKDNPLTIENSTNATIGGIAGGNVGQSSGNMIKTVIEYTSEFVNPFSGDAGIYVKFITNAPGAAPGGVAGNNQWAKIQFSIPVNIYASLTSNSEKQYLGGIGGSISSTEIIGPISTQRVNVTCTITSNYNKVYVGGIAGIWWGTKATNIHVSPMELTSNIKTGVYNINENIPLNDGAYAGLVGLFDYTSPPDTSYYDMSGSYCDGVITEQTSG